MRNYLLLWVVSVTNAYKASNDWRNPRGGASSHPDSLSSLTNNDEIDQFIDSLVASIDTSDAVNTVNTEEWEQEDSLARYLPTSQPADAAANVEIEINSDDLQEPDSHVTFGSSTSVNELESMNSEADHESDSTETLSDNNSESEKDSEPESTELADSNIDPELDDDLDTTKGAAANKDAGDSDDETDSDDEISEEANISATESKGETDSDREKLTALIEETRSEAEESVDSDKESTENKGALSADVEESSIASEVDDKVDGGDSRQGSDRIDEVEVKPVETPIAFNAATEDSSSGKRRKKVRESEKETDGRIDRSENRISVTRPQPPNALYRFLLRQGRIGHSVVMLLVLIVEWIHRYFPTLANVLGAIMSRVLPQSKQSRELPSSPRRKGAPSKVKTISSRTGQSGKKRKAISRQADQVALAQLRRIGNVDQVKYFHVSDDFMRRHGLGPYAKEGTDVDDEKAVMSVAQDAKAKAKVDKYDDDDEEDWVSQALIEDKPKRNKSSLKPSITPTLAVEVGSGTPSVTVGVEFGFGGSSQTRQAVVQSVSSRRRKRKVTSTGPRASDKDGGDGLLGRIRAASGANSMVSRSLLGAYPGDAVPPSEAASSRGLIDLARKYGWGEWSDDDEEGEGLVPARRKKRRRRKTDRLSSAKKPDRTAYLTRNGGSKNFGSENRLFPSSARSRSPDPPLSNSLLLSESLSTSKKKTVRMIRPAMETLKETKKKLKNNKEE